MNAPRVAVVTIVRGRHAHLAGQVRGLVGQARAPDSYVVVAIDDPAAHEVVRGSVPTEWDLRTPVAHLRDGRMPLSAARNFGAATAIAAGAEHLVFLDVDCVPSPSLVQRYSEVLADAPAGAGPRVLCGDVAYERAPGADASGDTSPRHHPARPAMAPGEIRTIDDMSLFWSLSFAVTAQDITAVGGFDEDYVGYGAEDTDFGQRLARSGGRLLFVGGAAAVHQYHPTAIPPVQHVADIVANANVFAGKWGWWPMLTWLEQFRDLDLVRQGPDGRWEALGGSTSPRPSLRRGRREPSAGVRPLRG